jgi:hypothetical protein
VTEVDQMNGVSPEGLKVFPPLPQLDKDQQDAVVAIEGVLKLAREGQVCSIAFVAIRGPSDFSMSFSGIYLQEQYVGCDVLKQHLLATMQGTHPNQIAAKQREEATKAKILRPGMMPPGMKL